MNRWNIVLLSGSIMFLVAIHVSLAALNIDFRLDVTKTSFFPNETIPVNLSIINREVTFPARNVSVALFVGRRVFNYNFPDLSAAQSVANSLILPEQPPGTYLLHGVMNYTDYLGEKVSLDTYSSFEVTYPPVARLPRNVYIKSIDLPDNVTAGKTYTVNASVANDGNIPADLTVVIESLDANVSKNTHLDPSQTADVSLDVQFYNPGISVVEAKLYATVDGIKYLMNYDSKNVYVEENKVAKLELDRTELVDKPDGQINQNDNISLNIYLRNAGNDAASVEKSVLSSSIPQIQVKQSEDYKLILAKESLGRIFQIETMNADVGDYNLSLDVSYSDSSGTHSSTLSIPVTIKKEACTSDNQCTSVETCVSGICTPLNCASDSYPQDHHCVKYECVRDSDCASKGSDYVCNTKLHICQSLKCPEGQVLVDGTTDCIPVSSLVGYPKDTQCQNGWPSHEGKDVWINEKNSACDLFEMTNPAILEIAQETSTCFSSKCNDSSCHSFCKQALKQSDSTGIILTATNFKKFAGLYLTYGLGPAAKFMKQYFWPEVNCDETGVCKQKEGFNAYAQQLECKGPVGQPIGWASDTDMSKNSCVFSDLPAHVNLNILHTGTCVDYSVSLTTLLRYVGYGVNEVYSVTGPGHEYDLVKFPGNSKWNLVDTVGNNPSPYIPNDVPGSWFPYCEYYNTSCANDGGQGNCPTTSEVFGC